MPNVGIGEWMIILVILLLLFGPSKLAGLGAAAGKTIKEFRNAMNETVNEIKDDKTDKPQA
jgi:sec-independent protein translocase protein TatA